MHARLRVAPTTTHQRTHTCACAPYHTKQHRMPGKNVSSTTQCQTEAPTHSSNCSLLKLRSTSLVPSRMPKYVKHTFTKGIDSSRNLTLPALILRGLREGEDTHATAVNVSRFLATSLHAHLPTPVPMTASFGRRPVWDSGGTVRRAVELDADIDHRWTPRGPLLLCSTKSCKSPRFRPTSSCCPYIRHTAFGLAEVRTQRLHGPSGCDKRDM
jgi:hypothetical protein